MTIRKMFIQSLSITLLATCLMSCSENAHPYDDVSEPYVRKSREHAKENRGTKMLATVEEGIPQLEGGSEKVQRPTEPALNSVLQKKYPHTVVLRGSTEDNKVALTFDDGPDRRFTPRVLDVLRKHDVKATFFLMGSRVKGLPGITKRIDEEGHAIGNHTYWHPKLYAEGPGRMKWEVSKTEQIIHDVIGYRTTLFRAPYGGLNEELVENMAEMGLTVVGWSVDSLDWKGIPAAEVEHNVLSTTKPGSIILMHSGGHWTQDLSGMVEALDIIIPKLKQEGLQFVTIGELLKIGERKL